MALNPILRSRSLSLIMSYSTILLKLCQVKNELSQKIIYHIQYCKGGHCTPAYAQHEYMHWIISFNPVYIHSIYGCQGNVKYFLSECVIYLQQPAANLAEGLRTLIPSTLCLFWALMLFGILWGIMGHSSAYILVYRSGNESLVSSPNRRVHITSSAPPSMRKASFIM